MKKFLLIPSALLAAFVPAYGVNYIPVAVNAGGFDFDTVVESNATAGANGSVYVSAANSLDAVNSAFYEAGLTGSTGGTGLPSNEQLTATVGGDSFTFNLATYGNNTGLSNNALQIGPTNVNQTLTLTTPASYTGFAFLGFSTEAQNFDAVGDVTVNFSDLTSTTYDNVLDLPDWYTGVSTVEDPLIFNSQGRVQTATGMYNQSLGQLSPTTGGQLYANMLTLSAGDQLKTVQSITFSITGAAAEDRTYILAVSAVPEPGSVALIVFGGLVLAGRRTRRLQA